MTVQNCGQHKRLVQERVDTLLIGLNANDTVLGEGTRACGLIVKPVH